jgi:exosortase/archaeosortase
MTMECLRYKCRNDGLWIDTQDTLYDIEEVVEAAEYQGATPIAQFSIFCIYDAARVMCQSMPSREVSPLTAIQVVFVFCPAAVEKEKAAARAKTQAVVASMVGSQNKDESPDIAQAISAEANELQDPIDAMSMEDFDGPEDTPAVDLGF